MISFFKGWLLMGLLGITNMPNDATEVKMPCNELGLYFMLPVAFNSIDSLHADALSKRGEKAIKETMNREILQGWQPGCLNLQDSLKRTVAVTAITAKEAIAQSRSADKFIQEAFKDGNEFIIQRFKSKMNIDIDEREVAQQSEITIAGLQVKKNAFTLVAGTRLLFFARYYFFQKDGKLILLTFLGSGKATDNEDIVAAIETAKKM